MAEHAYYIKCEKVIKDKNTGKVIELHCTYDPHTRGGWSKDGRKVRGTLHWVSTAHAIKAEVRLYEHLFSKANPDDVEEGQNFLVSLNPNSLLVLKSALLEPSLANAQPGSSYQFLRHGYFCVDIKDSRPGALVFNRTVTLRDSWSKIEKKV